MAVTIRSERLGETLTILRTGEETGGALLEMEAQYAPKQRWETSVEHLHPYQDESFAVLEGMLSVRVVGQERTYVAGESFFIARGMRHTMRNLGSVPVRIHWEVRPALQTQSFFTTIFHLADAGKLFQPLQFAVLARAYDRVFQVTTPSRRIQVLVFPPLAFIGRLFGYRVQYPMDDAALTTGEV